MEFPWLGVIWCRTLIAVSCKGHCFHIHPAFHSETFSGSWQPLNSLHPPNSHMQGLDWLLFKTFTGWFMLLGGAGTEVRIAVHSWRVPPAVHINLCFPWESGTHGSNPVRTQTGVHPHVHTSNHSSIRPPLLTTSAGSNLNVCLLDQQNSSFPGIKQTLDNSIQRKTNWFCSAQSFQDIRKFSVCVIFMCHHAVHAHASSSLPTNP